MHSIVERAGGTIGVRTEVGRGTTFTITLPIRAPSAADLSVGGAVAGSIPEPATTAMTILLVEDSVPVRVAVRAMLVKLGYVVRDVASAAEALAYVDAGEDVDLLLSDVVLDGANGRQLAGEIVRRRPGTPVVLMSGHADDELLQSGTSPHAHVLAKPFSFTQLADAIRDALRSNVVT